MEANSNFSIKYDEITGPPTAEYNNWKFTGTAVSVKPSKPRNSLYVFLNGTGREKFRDVDGEVQQLSKETKEWVSVGSGRE
jgi:hypothetical protein